MFTRLAALSMLLFPSIGTCDALQESWCVDALEQVIALKAGSPVYKLSREGPQYIEDADRPAEIARLQKIISTSCSADPKEKSRQEYEAYRLHVARSPECGIDLETLLSMENPDSRNLKEDIAQQRKVVSEKCPAVRLSNRWLVLYTGSIEEPKHSPSK